VSKETYLGTNVLRPWTWEVDASGRDMWSHWSADLEEALVAANLAYRTEDTAPAPDEADRLARFDAVKRWFQDDWMRIEPKLRTSIVEGISSFLSLFDVVGNQQQFAEALAKAEIQPKGGGSAASNGTPRS